MLRWQYTNGASCSLGWRIETCIDYIHLLSIIANTFHASFRNGSLRFLALFLFLVRVWGFTSHLCLYKLPGILHAWFLKLFQMAGLFHSDFTLTAKRCIKLCIATSNKGTCLIFFISAFIWCFHFMVFVLVHKDQQWHCFNAEGLRYTERVTNTLD